MLKVINSTDSKKWNETLKEFDQVDFYFLNGNQQDNDKEGDSSHLLVYSDQEYTLGLPIVKRKIPDSSSCDITSVYGYCGPLRSAIEIPEDIIDGFKNSLKVYFQQEKVISVFARLHPLFIQDDLLEGLGEVKPLGQTISIDLFKPIDEQRRQYRKGVKSDLSKLRKMGYEVFHDEKLDFLDEFISIYNENMKRVNADASYFFSKGYYEKLFNSEDIDARLYFVKNSEGVLIAGSIFLFTDEIIQYHLSGARNAYLKNSPVRLLIDFIRLYGTENKYKFFHLGGGLGSSEDSLFDFKAGFSKARHDFKIWRYIVDEAEYNRLVEENNVTEQSNYFPLYRLNNKKL